MKLIHLFRCYIPYTASKQMLRIMKVTIVIMTAFLMQASAITYAQQITLRESNLSLKKVFTEIRRQTGYTVLYRTEVINQAKPVNLDLNKVPLEEALKEILEGQSLDYVIKDKAIFVSKKEPSFLENVIARFRAIDVRGRVVDAEGNPLPGATVKVKGLKQMATTNAEGEFYLPGVADNSTLVISYIGYENKEVAVKADLGSITMNLISNDLTEVTVNKGYYKTAKILETGDVTNINADQIGRQPINNPLSALQGTVPGIMISQTTGVSGGGFNVQIRGRNSLNNGNDPFYVVDGIPYASQTLGSINGALQGGNPLNFINPNDIESISVLKDADATAIYGSRGANGVVLITTKKGKAGTNRVDFTLSSGAGRSSQILKDLLNTQQYLEIRNEAFNNDGITPDNSNAPDLTLWDTSRYTDWQKLFLGGTAHYTDLQGSVSGGSTNVQYLFGGAYHREGTVMPGDGANQKASVHFNINSSSLNQKLKAALSGSFLANTNTISPVDLSSSIFLAPDAPELYTSDGSINWAPVSPGGARTWNNPMADFLSTYKGVTNTLLANSVISYQLLSGLQLKTNLGYSNSQTREVNLQPLKAFDPADNLASGYSNFLNTRASSWIIEPQAVFDAALGKGKLNILLGTTFQQDGSERERFGATGFSSDALLDNISAATSLTTQPIINRIYKYAALFGRLNYNWLDRYLINITARRDASSRFGPGKQIANFQSVAGAWIFSQENFFKDHLGFLSLGKLKISYGTTGSDQVGDYRFIDLYSNTRFAYQSIKGLFPSNLFNPDLAWELNKKFETGLDLGFFKSRLSLGLNYYRNRSSNQLVTSGVPLTTGFPTIDANLPATVQNSGFEGIVSSTTIKTLSFTWSTSLNLTIPKNKLVAYPGLETSPLSNRFVIGQPLTIEKIYHTIGVDKESGVYQFADENGNPTYNPAIASSYVDIAPKFYGGFQNSLSYKQFSLFLSFQFVKQKGKNPLTRTTPGQQFNITSDLLDRWRSPGDNTPIQRFSQDYNSDASNAFGNYYSQSDAVYLDASFVRLKNAELSFAFDEQWVQRMKMKNLRIFMQGQNLITVSHYKGFDPEIQGQVLPTLKMVTIGLQVGL